MSISPENAHGRSLRAGQPRRAGRELVLEAVFRPLSNALVPVLVRARVPPPAVVLANAATGLLAAWALASGNLVLAALLLQAKTLLDNTDGSLARASGRVTLAGRYLDTEADLVVNAALFAALAHVTGRTLTALAAFLALTLVLAVDYNVSALAREARDGHEPSPRASGGRVERFLARAYAAVFAPQDDLLRAVSRERLARAIGAETRPERVRAATLAYFDRASLTVLANLGLSTQLVALGACLVLGAPVLYLWLVLACLPLLVALELRSERLARRALPG